MGPRQRPAPRKLQSPRPNRSHLSCTSHLRHVVPLTLSARSFMNKAQKPSATTPRLTELSRQLVMCSGNPMIFLPPVAHTEGALSVSVACLACCAGASATDHANTHPHMHVHKLALPAPHLASSKLGFRLLPTNPTPPSAPSAHSSGSPSRAQAKGDLASAWSSLSMPHFQCTRAGPMHFGACDILACA